MGTHSTTRFTDWHEVHEAVAAAYFPHEMRPLTTGAASRSALKSATIGSCRITSMRLGAEVSVATDHPGAYGVNIPVSGRFESVVGKTAVLSLPGQATICPPDTRTVIPHWGPSCRLIGFKVEKSYLQHEMDRVLGRPGKLPMQIDLRSGRGASWLKFVQTVFHQVADDAGLWRDSLVLTQLAGTLTTAFVLAATPDEEDSHRGARPRIVKRVIDAIHADPARAWTPGEMAELAGVSVRRLQQGFRECMNQTPFEYLFEVRLERAHAELVSAGPPATVADIAFRCGITHTGRFAAAYRDRYGSTPSETLKR
ncbi:AraC family transcriptional regulator [Rhodococcus sp. JS3073]|uniref:AraC family transcriptional regulator n=1 Tax=Rhodococcus sp. JS3073 TaxID=3002901 RepID=UPI0022858F56|nr:AraC family transcriptional regulator [Rhodococcus sp. JS3073]WAM19730.1 AraC family transcriptional regulator [Rhodococcus sp. JS3073]